MREQTEASRYELRINLNRKRRELGFISVLQACDEKIDITRRSWVPVEVVCVTPNHHKPNVRRDHQLDKLFETLGKLHSRVP
jgi:hypothetical protein